MTKIIIFWLLGLLTLVVVIGGGSWLFFWVIAKAKKNKLF